MNIKDRFTLLKNVVTEESIVVDNLNKITLSLMETEEICMREYGEHFNAKSKYISKFIDYILASVEYYNSNCEKGFEITINDLIHKIMTHEKKI